MTDSPIYIVNSFQDIPDNITPVYLSQDNSSLHVGTIQPPPPLLQPSTWTEYINALPVLDHNLLSQFQYKQMMKFTTYGTA